MQSFADQAFVLNTIVKMQWPRLAAIVALSWHGSAWQHTHRSANLAEQVSP
jgi:hypothetical protein